MRIGILGPGRMGSHLGTMFARVGHEVSFSYSRNQQKLSDLAASAGKNAQASTPAEAALNAATWSSWLCIGFKCLTSSARWMN